MSYIVVAYCRTMAKDSDEESDDEVVNVPCTAEENDMTGVIQPFSRTASIVMNIKVCVFKPLTWISWYAMDPLALRHSESLIIDSSATLH